MGQRACIATNVTVYKFMLLYMYMHYYNSFTNSTSFLAYYSPNAVSLESKLLLMLVGMQSADLLI